MHKFKKTKGKTAWVAMKLDMKKAYDRLEWDFIQKCLLNYGFHSVWINWIMECITQCLILFWLMINLLVWLDLLGEFDKEIRYLHTSL